MRREIILLICVFLIIFILGKKLNPFDKNFFTFHDETQPARIEQFTKELKNFHLPPRVASDMNFGIGYPVFNFYAPFPYWVASSLHLLGLSIINSLKISFLLTLLIGFLGAFAFLKNFFDFYPSLLGGFFYVTSLYFPLNIFVRGNLGELWFLALFPVCLYFIIKTAFSQKIDKKIFLTNIIILSFLLTSHNIFSFISIPILLAFIFNLKNNYRSNLLALFLAFLFSSYFWLPLILELKYVWAGEVATQTKFSHHLLCPHQLWQSEWGYGGSTVGCQNDGMSFKIGKLQLIFFASGILLFLVKFKKIKKKKILLFFLIYSLLSLYLTTYQSAFLWQIFSPILSFIQFPWRLIGFSLLGISFFSAYFFNEVKIPFKNFIILFLVILTAIINGKYFVGQSVKNHVFEERYLSDNYIKNLVAFKVAEYLPKSNDYYYWRSLEGKNISEEEAKKLSLKPFLKNRQTNTERIANFISLFSLLGLIYFLLVKNGAKI